MRTIALVIAAVTATACLRQTSYPCSSNNDCGAGVCEQVGFCSFSDTGCSGGRRFGELSGQYANQCVGGGDGDGGVDSSIDAAIDAGIDGAIDAPGCPGSYTMMGTTSYRFVATAADWATAEADCADDGVGTHLVVAADAGENTVVDTISTASRTWLGVSDRKVAGTWRWVTGGSAPVVPPSVAPGHCGIWYDGTGGGTPIVQNRDCAVTYAYLCECDRVAPDPTAF